MPQISIIVPVYNVEPYLRRCVDSILAQTFTDFELILVDDGSPDNCGVICDEYARIDSRVKVIHQENKGQAAARNAAVREADGDWISFVDADDLIHSAYLSVLLSAISEQKATIACCHALEAVNCPQSFFYHKEPVTFQKAVVNEEALLSLFKEPFLCWIVWCKLLPKEIVQRFPFTDGRVYEDNAIAVKWLYEAGEILYTDTALYYYQINPNGTTKGPKTTKKRLDYLWALSEQLDFFREKQMELLLKKRLFPFLISCKNLLSDIYLTEPAVAKKVQKSASSWIEYAKHHEVFTKRQFLYVLINLNPVWLSLKCVIKRMIKK